MSRQLLIPFPEFSGISPYQFSIPFNLSFHRPHLPCVYREGACHPDCLNGLDLGFSSYDLCKKITG